ncbi:hypothetical protein TrST_g1523 [Triparma strigata]|uniref:Tubulin--tyrosine ligase-like protein 9 n=1 Tax=Triparma strigata TaxID=1606541 RepID=A0A9W7BV11_9STRA|nr:hypothetical protein TrST_g1523 [Triparma strigata]
MSKPPSQPVQGKPSSAARVFYFRTTFRNAIYEALKRRGWKETDGDNWDLHWTEREWMSEVFDSIHLSPTQRVNHFRNQRELCRKDLMVKNLKRHKRQLQKEQNPEADAYSFWPLTYVLPGDYALFVEEFKKYPTSFWIMKPVGRAQGKGIFLFKQLKEIAKWKSDSRYNAENKDAETYVVQRYISNPYLVAGRKFDIRLYALVTSYNPLTVWLHRSGFCRFSSTRYSNSATTMQDTTMHLTNVAIQKKSDTYDSETGGKWSLRDLKLYLMSRYGVAVVDRLFNEMEMTIMRCLFSVQNIMMNDKHCFELYGFDVLFDDSFKVYVIEVNASPSMSANTKEDMDLKVGLLSNAFDIVDIEGKMQGNETRVGGFDLIHKGIPIKPNSATSLYTTNLGCDIPDDIVRSSENTVGSTTNGGTPKEGEEKSKSSRSGSKAGIAGRPAFGAGGRSDSRAGRKTLT